MSTHGEARAPIKREVEVRINYDQNTKRIVGVDPVNFRVSKGHNQEVKWVCNAPVDFMVDFSKNGCPFYETQFSNDHPYSGLVRADVMPHPDRIYEYSVWVGNHKLDPGGGVDP